MSLNYVKFQVGEHMNVCHRQTLEKFPNSALAKYVAPEFDTRKSGDEFIVIDRDGKYFATILNYMRDQSSLDLTRLNDVDLSDLLREADFYCLDQLIQLCEIELSRRDPSDTTDSSSRSFTVPAHYKLEVILDLFVMRQLLDSVRKPTIVISQWSMKRFHIEAWFAELVKLCDHDRFNVYAFSDKNGKSETPLCTSGPQLNWKNFVVALYEPSEGQFAVWIQTPTDEKFRAKRASYKCKIYKFWFVIQNDMLQALEKQRLNYGLAESN